MSLLLLGISHASAPIHVRERVAFAPEQLTEALQDARQVAGLEEIAILSTCNRTELVCALPEEAKAQAVTEWLASYHHMPMAELGPHLYQYQGPAALGHLMRVGCGLESMVLGEPQILGQLKDAFASAQGAGTLGTELHRALQYTFATAKQVRTDTAIGENPVSVAYAAVMLSTRIFADLRKTRALLIGAGETIELVARHLRENGVKQIVVANRTLQRARDLAARFDGEAVLLAEVPEQLASADIVIASTASQLPILGKGAVEAALKKRKHRPIFMVDIAVPRDIEAQVGELDDVYLYTVDDLQDIVRANKDQRSQEAEKAAGIIEQAVTRYQWSERSLGAVETLKAYRVKAESLRDQELERALKALRAGVPAEEALAQLARGLTNKLIHAPSIQMKKASADGRHDLLAWSRELFELHHTHLADDDS